MLNHVLLRSIQDSTPTSEIGILQYRSRSNAAASLGSRGTEPHRPGLLRLKTWAMSLRPSDALQYMHLNRRLDNACHITHGLVETPAQYQTAVAKSVRILPVTRQFSPEISSQDEPLCDAIGPADLLVTKSDRNHAVVCPATVDKPTCLG